MSARLDEANARRVADDWLAGQRFPVELRTFKAVETRRSWIFATAQPDGMPAFGNAPLIVDKRTGALKGSWAAFCEFAARPSLLDRARRRWNRLVHY